MDGSKKIDKGISPRSPRRIPIQQPVPEPPLIPISELSAKRKAPSSVGIAKQQKAAPPKKTIISPETTMLLSALDSYHDFGNNVRGTSSIFTPELVKNNIADFIRNTNVKKTFNDFIDNKCTINGNNASIEQCIYDKYVKNNTDIYENPEIISLNHGYTIYKDNIEEDKKDIINIFHHISEFYKIGVGQKIVIINDSGSRTGCREEFTYLISYASWFDGGGCNDSENKNKKFIMDETLSIDKASNGLFFIDKIEGKINKSGKAEGNIYYRTNNKEIVTDFSETQNDKERPKVEKYKNYMDDKAYLSEIKVPANKMMYLMDLKRAGDSLQIISGLHEISTGEIPIFITSDYIAATISVNKGVRTILTTQQPRTDKNKHSLKEAIFLAPRYLLDESNILAMNLKILEKYPENQKEKYMLYKTQQIQKLEQLRRNGDNAIDKFEYVIKDKSQKNILQKIKAIINSTKVETRGINETQKLTIPIYKFLVNDIATSTSVTDVLELLKKHKISNVSKLDNENNPNFNNIIKVSHEKIKGLVSNIEAEYAYITKADIEHVLKDIKHNIKDFLTFQENEKTKYEKEKHEIIAYIKGSRYPGWIKEQKNSSEINNIELGALEWLYNGEGGIFEEIEKLSYFSTQKIKVIKKQIDNINNILWAYSRSNNCDNSIIRTYLEYVIDLSNEYLNDGAIYSLFEVLYLNLLEIVNVINTDFSKDYLQNERFIQNFIIGKYITNIFQDADIYKYTKNIGDINDVTKNKDNYVITSPFGVIYIEHLLNTDWTNPENSGKLLSTHLNLLIGNYFLQSDIERLAVTQLGKHTYINNVILDFINSITITKKNTHVVLISPTLQNNSSSKKLSEETANTAKQLDYENKPVGYIELHAYYKRQLFNHNMYMEMEEMYNTLSMEMNGGGSLKKHNIHRAFVEYKYENLDKFMELPFVVKEMIIKLSHNREQILQDIFIKFYNNNHYNIITVKQQLGILAKCKKTLGIPKYGGFQKPLRIFKIDTKTVKYNRTAFKLFKEYIYFYPEYIDPVRVIYNIYSSQ